MALLPYFDEGKIEAGCDEAGRGCLAGPVVAAAVIINKTFHHSSLNDSKTLSMVQRNEMRKYIEQHATCYAVAFIYPEEIDKINILNASIKAMHVALEKLIIRPELLLIDGNRFHNYNNIRHQCIIKGDSKFMSIAAASVLAKTYRDEYMINQSQLFPNYEWEKNKGYPTKNHRKAIQKYGSNHLHRKSFNLLPDEQLRIDF